MINVETSALYTLVSMVLRDYTSEEVREIVDHFNPDNYAGDFCHHFELGEWLEEAFNLYGIDVHEEVERCFREKRLYERDTLDELSEIRDARRG
jgi:hypothetical protein